jgi:outer membrane protein assembly factor BamD
MATAIATMPAECPVVVPDHRGCRVRAGYRTASRRRTTEGDRNVTAPRTPTDRAAIWSRALARVCVVATVGVILAGCSSISGLLAGKDDDLPPEQPADRLYNEGVYLLNEKKDAKEAAKKFEEVDRQHPYSDWARKSLLMSAYSFYEAGKYDDSIGAAKRFVQLHPGSPDVAYAQYLIGASYFDQIPDVSRDQSGTQRAVAALEEVIRKFPTSEYATQARRKIEVARDALAAKEMAVARYYLEKKNFIGAINRFKVVVTQYQTTRHVEEALMRLTEAYMTLGIVAEAQTAAAVLGHNFPDSPWYKDAYNLVRGGGLEPTENKGSWISRAFGKVGLG